MLIEGGSELDVVVKSMVSSDFSGKDELWECIL